MSEGVVYITARYISCKGTKILKSVTGCNPRDQIVGGDIRIYGRPRATSYSILAVLFSMKGRGGGGVVEKNGSWNYV